MLTARSHPSRLSQNSLLDASDALAHRLSYFSSLEPAVRMLNSPGEALVLSEGFLPMVDRIDDCLRFLKTHVRHIFVSMKLSTSSAPRQNPRKLT